MPSLTDVITGNVKPRRRQLKEEEKPKNRKLYYGLQNNPVDKFQKIARDAIPLLHAVDLMNKYGGRPTAASSGAITELLTGGGLSGAGQAIKDNMLGETEDSYKDTLRAAGLGDNRATSALGMGADMVLDPLNFLPVGAAVGAVKGASKMAIPGRAVNKAAQTIEELVKLIRSGGGFDDAGKMLPKPATLLERSKMQRPSSGILDNAAPINAGEDQLVSSLLDSQRRMNQGVNQHFFPSSRGMASEIPAKSPGMGVTPPTTPNAPIPGIMSRVGGAIGRNKGKTALGSAIAGLAGYGALRGDATPEQPSIGNEELMKKLVEAGITPDVMMAIMQDPSGRAMDIVKAITSKQQGPASSAPSSGMARPQPSRQFTPNPQMPTQLPPQFEQAQLERQDLNNPFAGLTQSPNAMGAPQNLGRTKRRNPLLGAIAGFGKGLGNAFLGR